MEQDWNAINRAISESIEPVPANGRWENGVGRLSTGGAWVRHFDGSTFKARNWLEGTGPLELLKRLIRKKKSYSHVWEAIIKALISLEVHSVDEEAERIGEAIVLAAWQMVKEGK